MTDSRHYSRLSSGGALRFCAAGQRRDADLGRIHGTDERQRVEHFRGGLCTTRRTLQLLGAAAGGAAGPGAAGGRGRGAEEGGGVAEGADGRDEL